MVIEGSGGVICPIRYDEKEHIMLDDIIKSLDLETVIIADGGLGTINATILTITYLKLKNISIKGVIINNYDDSEMQQDNIKMIEEITNIPVIAKVKQKEVDIDMQVSSIIKLFEEV